MKSFRQKKVLGLLCFLCIFSLVGLVVMLLWNALLPTILGVSTISYLQSLGILVLSRLLFGGIGHWGRHHGMRHHHAHHHMSHSRKKDFFEIHDKLRGMSREEKVEFMRRRMNDFNDKDDEK